MYTLLYQNIIQYVQDTAKTLRHIQHSALDLHLKEEEVTQEDIRIEREISTMITASAPKDKIYGEESHTDVPVDALSWWSIDPISATSAFLAGHRDYAIVISHIFQGEVVFSCICVPGIDFLCTAEKGKGVTLHGNFLHPASAKFSSEDVLYVTSKKWMDRDFAERCRSRLQGKSLFKLGGSVALAEIACVLGQGYSGGLILAKDSFPHFAAKLIIEEQGGIFTGISGDSFLRPSDRIFIFGRSKESYQEIYHLVTS